MKLPHGPRNLVADIHNPQKELLQEAKLEDKALPRAQASPKRTIVVDENPAIPCGSFASHERLSRYAEESRRNSSAFSYS